MSIQTRGNTESGRAAGERRSADNKQRYGVWVTGTYCAQRWYTPHFVSACQTESTCSVFPLPHPDASRCKLWGLTFEPNKWFCVGATTVEIIKGPLASLLLINLCPTMSCVSPCVLFLCVCRISPAQRPFSGSLPRGLWFSRETRGSTSSNGTNVSLILVYQS